jgi:hypothetical protein
MEPTMLRRRLARMRGAAMRVMLLCAAAASATGCASTQTEPPQLADPAPSPVLTAELGAVVDEAVQDATAREALRVSPDELDAFVESVRLSMLAQYDRDLLTTPDEEERYRAGVFAHTSNRARVQRLLGQLHDDGVPLTTVEAYLAGQLAADRLAGARLELAARILRARYDAVLMGELLSVF